MTTNLTRFSRVFSVLVWVLRGIAGGLGRGLRAVLRGVWNYVLISGSHPSLTRDPGLAAYRLTEGRQRRARPFRDGTVANVVADEPYLHFVAF